MLELFPSKATTDIPKFDPDNDKYFYARKCAGGPHSNNKESKASVKTPITAVIIIQKYWRVWKAKKILVKLIIHLCRC